MRGLLSRLIQRNQSQSQSPAPAPAPEPARQQPARRQFMFRSHSQRPTPSLPAPATTEPPSHDPPSPQSTSPQPTSPPTTFNATFNATTNMNNTPIFSTPLESNESTSIYYSLFEYNDYNIRYHHNERIHYDDSLEIINSILQYIYEPDFEPEFEEPDFEPEPFKGNDDNTKNHIMKNMLEAQYKDVKYGLKNDSCPILYCAFEDNDPVCVFKPCNHGIHQSTQDQFLYHFQKCPLCNVSLK